MNTILTNVSPEQVRTDPFPHLVIENALPAELAAQLLAQMPTLDTITQGKPYRSNQRFSYNAHDVLSQDIVSPLWREFVQHHVAPGFYTDVIRVFGPALRRAWPELADRLTASDPILGLRNRDSMESVDIVMDCQICLNTPVVGQSTAVKISHLDNPHELFAGLLYLRPEDDHSTGGDLELYRYRTSQPKFHGARLVNRRFVERVATIPYQHNTLILFLNTFHALHGVTARSVTDRPRYLINFLGEVKEELFDLRPYRENTLDKILRHVWY